MFVVALLAPEVRFSHRRHLLVFLPELAFPDRFGNNPLVAGQQRCVNLPEQLGAEFRLQFPAECGFGQSLLPGFELRDSLRHCLPQPFYLAVVEGVGGIDGFYFRSSFDLYKEMALINPPNAPELCDELAKKTGIPVVLMDANDIDQNQLGKCADFPLTDDQIQDAMKDNPSGQGDELTPLILIRPLS